jgi:flagellar FliL protein
MASAAAEVTDTSAPAPKKKGGGFKKKLILLLAVVLLVVLAGGGAMVVILKRRAAAAAEDGGDGSDAAATTPADTSNGLPKRDLKNPPAFVPLEMFTVNLADAEAERYAQIGVTLELADAHAADEIKAFMPAIRSNILMVLARKTSKDLLDPAGKDRLAFEIKREASRALGIDVPDESPAASGAAKKKTKSKRPLEESPIRQVYFSNFIIQ